MSARAKFTGQIITGLLLGGYLVYNPITVSAWFVQDRDILDWNLLTSQLVAADNSPTAYPELSAILEKLNLKSTADLVRYALEHKLV